MNENSSEIKNAVVINVCSNCNNNIIDISCCPCKEQVSCNFAEKVLKISIKHEQLLLDFLKPLLFHFFILSVDFLQKRMYEISNNIVYKYATLNRTMTCQNFVIILNSYYGLYIYTYDHEYILLIFLVYQISKVSICGQTGHSKFLTIIISLINFVIVLVITLSCLMLFRV